MTVTVPTMSGPVNATGYRINGVNCKGMISPEFIFYVIYPSRALKMTSLLLDFRTKESPREKPDLLRMAFSF